MGNPETKHKSGPCKSCNANGGLWYDEPQTVHCLRPGDSSRHVIRGIEATRENHDCWRPGSEPLPVEIQLALKRRTE